jgi:hypothetical protein
MKIHAPRRGKCVASPVCRRLDPSVRLYKFPNESSWMLPARRKTSLRHDERRIIERSCAPSDI